MWSYRRESASKSLILKCHKSQTSCPRWSRPNRLLWSYFTSCQVSLTCKKRGKDVIHLLSTMEFVFPVANAILYSFMGPRFQKDLLRLVFINGSCRLICNRMTYIGHDNLMKIWKPSKDSLVDSRTNVRFNYFDIKYLFFYLDPSVTSTVFTSTTGVSQLSRKGSRIGESRIQQTKMNTLEG